jgi:peptidylglycine monooxygenase
VQVGGVSDVAVDSHDRVYLYQRTDPPVIVFDGSGAYVTSWGTGTISDAHGIFCTPDDRIVVADRDAHQILGFDVNGNLLFALGERHAPQFQAPFNHPADVAVNANGDIYVADGYANSTVHVFSSTGELKRTWGRPGTGPGEFTTPHAVRTHPDGRVLVCDRENHRLQVFTPEGEFLAAWGDFFRPMDVYVDVQGFIYVTDQVPRLSMLAPDGTLMGRCRPVLNGAHGIFGDSQGNFYLAEVAPESRLTKLVRL